MKSSYLKILLISLLIMLICFFNKAFCDFIDSILSENSIETLSEETIYEVIDKQTDRNKVTFIVKDVHKDEKVSFYIVDTLAKNKYYSTFKYIVVGDEFIYKGDGNIECIENE